MGEAGSKSAMEDFNGPIPDEGVAAVGFFFSSRRRHTRLQGDWSSDVCSSDLTAGAETFGSQCMVVAIDARRREASDANRGWEVFTHGGRESVGWDAIEWAEREIGRASCRERV